MPDPTTIQVPLAEYRDRLRQSNAYALHALGQDIERRARNSPDPALDAGRRWAVDHLMGVAAALLDPANPARTRHDDC